MKKIVASVGVVALGASGVQAASVPSDTGEPVKPWSVSATLRGFYDDNINSISSSSGLKQDSFGYELSPSFLLNWTLEQTTFSLGYVYSLRYYENKPFNNVDHLDQNHTFNASLDHVFSERYRVNVRDSFVLGQEPDALRAGNAFQVFQRVPGDNIRNFGNITFDAQMTRQLGLELGYANTLWDYKDAEPIVDEATDQIVVASRSGTLDQIAHTIHLDGRWLLQPPTVGVLGYQYSQVDYTGNEHIGGSASDAGPGTFITSENRNSRSHYVYVGADHTFRPDLSGSLRVGGQYIDFYNDPTSSSDISPYVQMSLRYSYALESYVEGGFTYNRNSTDLVGYNLTTGGSQNFTADAQSAVLYATLNHRITPKLFGNLTGQFQDSTYNGGSFNNQSDRYYLLGLNLEYRFTRHLSAQVGYNYDKLDSDIAQRSFDRNRVYMGITASY